MIENGILYKKKNYKISRNVSLTRNEEALHSGNYVKTKVNKNIYQVLYGKNCTYMYKDEYFSIIKA